MRLRVTVADGETGPDTWRILDVDAAITLDELDAALRIVFEARDLGDDRFVSVPNDSAPPAAAASPTSATALGAVSASPGVAGSAEIDGETTLAALLDGGRLPVTTSFASTGPHERRLSGSALGAATADPFAGPALGPIGGGVRDVTLTVAALSGRAALPGEPRMRLVTAGGSGWSPVEPAGLLWAPEPERLRREAAAPDVGAINDALAAVDPGIVTTPEPGDSFARRVLPAYAPRIRSYLMPLRRSESVPADDISAWTDQELIEFLGPIPWLLDRVGDTGLPLSAKGYLPPAIVHEALGKILRGARMVGAGTREKTTPEVRALRRHLRRLGFVRSLSGRLVLTELGRRARNDPRLLWRELAERVVARQDAESERDAVLLFALDIARGGVDDHARRLELVAAGLSALGWVGDSALPIDEGTAGELSADGAWLFTVLAASESNDGANGAWHMRVSPLGRAFALDVVRSAEAAVAQ